MKIFKYTLLSIIGILIILRIALPYVLLHYVEGQINKLPDYRVKIADLDVHLYRGSYSLKKLQLWKVSNNIPVPFFEAHIIDLSVDWKSLLHGAFVAKIYLDKPIVHFVTNPSDNKSQLSLNEQWIQIVKSLFPLNINRIHTENGEVYYQSFDKQNLPFKTYINDVHFSMENMQNVEHAANDLPSIFVFSAHPMGGGTLNVDGKFNPFSKIPTFYLKGKLLNLDIKYLNSILKYYTKINVVKGNFSLYTEIAAAKGNIKGYMKPFLKNLEIRPEKNASPLNAIYNGAASVVAKLIENPDKETIATQIKLEGNVNDPNISILSVIGYLLWHGFIQALIPQIDHNVKMKDVIYQNPQPVH